MLDPTCHKPKGSPSTEVLDLRKALDICQLQEDSKLRPAGRGLQIKELATLDILKEPICGSAPFQFVCRP